jgi:hypothetical protein
VQYLIDAKGRNLDFSVLDKNGYSLVDQAALLLKNQKTNLELWEVPKEKWRELDLRRFENRFIIIRLLYRTGRAKPKKISFSVTRVEEDELQVILYGHENMFVMPAKISGEYSQSESPTKHPTAKADSNLELKKILANEQQFSIRIQSESSDPVRHWGEMVLKDYGLKLGLNDSVFGYSDKPMQQSEDDHLQGEERSVSGPDDQKAGEDAYSEFVSAIKKLRL